MSNPRIFLVAPTVLDGSFVAELADILGNSDVAILLLAADSIISKDQHSNYHKILNIAHQHEISVLIQNNLLVARELTADGVQIDSIQTLKQVMKEPKQFDIIGAGGIETKHDAMVKGETLIDYVFFGDCSRPENDVSDRNVLELSQWWAVNFKIPGVALAGKKLESISETAATGIDFIAIRDAIWDFPEGPKSAISKVSEILNRYEVRE